MRAYTRLSLEKRRCPICETSGHYRETGLTELSAFQLQHGPPLDSEWTPIGVSFNCTCSFNIRHTYAHVRPGCSVAAWSQNRLIHYASAVYLRDDDLHVFDDKEGALLLLENKIPLQDLLSSRLVYTLIDLREKHKVRTWDLIYDSFKGLC